MPQVFDCVNDMFRWGKYSIIIIYILSAGLYGCSVTHTELISFVLVIELLILEMNVVFFQIRCFRLVSGPKIKLNETFPEEMVILVLCLLNRIMNKVQDVKSEKQ
ncbi:hypothetical protein H8356DRAFT_934001 [Neocallimastix lanati (nom. inval.)]|uniref:Uncharacterized protein n=1 Tax=Neocallimastix californiae TaxID=1754190 RepID=A0A1Y2FHC2_9FUNG|nr:hypothetical protein H8356DRAFT_934001 [Neocallimastix sp. JGI-2020a]ORY83358.1 hypothetical protein LY90DRAFT_499551 [Neocallimastix californiae]|eukprot:ORY83358.1 hypothetical protein LY90DRAFT_499551 [Neocallimastix californiae]